VIEVRAPEASDRQSVLERVAESWGGRVIARRGSLVSLDDLPVLVAYKDRKLVGAAAYRLEAGEVEVVTLDAFAPGEGAGTALLEAVARLGMQAGCVRLWLITTNDNVDALAFYLRRGMRLAAVHQSAATAARVLKPSIPEVGRYGIPVEDEIELERWLVEARP
jgi:GNAT superfamily N-acetyltransferase